MATVTIKNIPDNLYTQLKTIAKVNRRSINSEIILCIERRLQGHRPSVDEMLQRAHHLRQLTKGHPISDEILNEAKTMGRP